jgi:fatty-acyl-CoA synthase
MEMHWATIWESIADVIPNRPAVSNGDVTRSWAEYDQRAARVAAALTAHGLGPDSKVGLYLYNGNEYLEAHYGALKVRAVPINVNYRYLDEELWYLLDNADAEALIFHRSLADRVSRVMDRLPGLKLLVEVDDGEGTPLDGAVPYEQLLADHGPMPRIERCEDDVYMLYTGGTTGMPKGVMFRIADLTRSLLLKPMEPRELAPDALAMHESGYHPTSVTGAPLMHGTGLWMGALQPHTGGAHVVTLTGRTFDAHELLAAIERHRCTRNTVVGDAFSRPIVRAIDESIAAGRPYDLSSLRFTISSGAMWTNEVKQALLERVPNMTLEDSMGSTEGGMASQTTVRGEPSETATFTAEPTTKVFDEFDREIEPGSDRTGMVATSSLVPIGYFKDPERSARTFRTIEGVRYSFPGDMAKIAADGSLILLGRGSNVINSAGEKIFPEEVEEAVKRVGGVDDCLVVGVDDERFGQAVTAVVCLAPGVTLGEDSVIAAAKEQLAGFKAPKRVVFVDVVPRAPNGKADYATARRLAQTSD